LIASAVIKNNNWACQEARGGAPYLETRRPDRYLVNVLPLRRFRPVIAGMMKTKTTFSLLAIASLALSGVAFAGGKTYQVTGQVVKVSDSMVVIQNGTQKWEIARDTTSKVKGDLKKGNTATVTYTMNATAVDVKAMPAAPAAKASPAAKAAPAKKAAPAMKVTAPAKSAVGDPDAQKKEEPNATATPTPDE
jgi:hypothetical protein